MTRYAGDRSARFEVVRRGEHLYEVWVQARQTDEDHYPGETWYVDTRDGAHFADTLETAVQIGGEALKNLTASGLEE